MNDERADMDLQQVLRNSAPCAVSIGSFGGGPGVAEHLPLAVLVAGFVAVGAWMFRRYGKGSESNESAAGTPPRAEAGAASGHPASLSA